MPLSKESMSEQALAWWVTGPSQGALQQAPVAMADSSTSEPLVTVEALFSGVSRGTEALVFKGQVPESEFRRMRAPFQRGEFPFPVKYGYANVGRVIEGPAHLQGQVVFCLFPHQQRYQVPAAAVYVLPDDVPAPRAVLAANMETAVNGLWDALPTVGDRILVVGLGVVGLLVGWLANQIPGTQVTVVDLNPARRAQAEALGLQFAKKPDAECYDLVFHTSGQPSGLTTALAGAGSEARVVEMSWYGNRLVEAPLGQAFHSRRLILRSSQVGRIAPHQQPRWDFARRMRLALSLLVDDRLDALITGETPFQDLPHAMPAILADDAGTLCQRIIY